MKIPKAALVLALLLPLCLDTGSGVLHAARVVVKVPQGVLEVSLLSPGTFAVLDRLRSNLDGRLRSCREKYQVERLEKEAAQARNELERARRELDDAIRDLKARVIAGLKITVDRAEVRILPESSMGEGEFFYAASNGTDAIVSDISYRPVVSGVTLPLTSPLVLEFINPSNLLLGLGPHEGMTNRGREPEKFNFFLSDLTEKDKGVITRGASRDFSLRIEDIHFVAGKGYKGQYRIMDVGGAFPGRIAAHRAEAARAEAESAAKAHELEQAKARFMAETRESMASFTSRAGELKKASVRARGVIDPRRNRAVFEGVAHGDYYVYAACPGGRAAVRELKVNGSRVTITLDSFGKDPFVP